MRKVKKVVVVPLFRNGRPLSDSKQKDEDRYLQLLHMYTHFDFNLCLQPSCTYVCMYVCMFYVLERMYLRIYNLSLLKPKVYIVHVSTYVCKHDSV